MAENRTDARVVTVNPGTVVTSAMARRSLLFSPGDRPELMRKAPNSGADVVTFDLEDAVAPGRKAEARDATHEVITDPAFDPDCEVCVRVNPTPTAADDLDAVLEGAPRIDSVMAPKIESASDAREIAELVTERGYDLPLVVLCESAAGVLHAEEIAATDAVSAVIFGAEDFSADVGAIRTRSSAEISTARQQVVMAAAAADIDALDTLVTEIEDDERLEEETAFARQLGFDGKVAIHPRQVPIINEGFAPDSDAIEWAERVLEAKSEADEAERGVFRVDGEMIDAPLVARAERILDLADAADRR